MADTTSFGKLTPSIFLSINPFSFIRTAKTAHNGVFVKNLGSAALNHAVQKTVRFDVPSASPNTHPNSASAALVDQPLPLPLPLPFAIAIADNTTADAGKSAKS
jgi:hypothetical protein